MSEGRLTASAFDVDVCIRWSGLPEDRDWQAELATALPPGADPTDGLGATEFHVSCVEGRWNLSAADGAVEHYDRLDHLRHALERRIAAKVAHDAPRRVFVHAGAVSTGRGAILLPGRSFAGKTTLVDALLRLDCGYLSDEFAVLDPSGAVSAYPRRLSHRVDGERVDADPPPAPALTTPIPVVAVAALRYRPDATLAVTRVPAGETAMHLIDNAVAARARPGEVLPACAAVARRAIGLHGVRGDAREAAQALLALLD